MAAVRDRPESVWFFFHEIRDMIFIFTYNFIDLAILSLLALSHYWLVVGRGQRGC